MREEYSSQVQGVRPEEQRNRRKLCGNHQALSDELAEPQWIEFDVLVLGFSAGGLRIQKQDLGCIDAEECTNLRGSGADQGHPR